MLYGLFSSASSYTIAVWWQHHSTITTSLPPTLCIPLPPLLKRPCLGSLGSLGLSLCPPYGICLVLTQGRHASAREGGIVLRKAGLQINNNGNQIKLENGVISWRPWFIYSLKTSGVEPKPFPLKVRHSTNRVLLSSFFFTFKKN